MMKSEHKNKVAQLGNTNAKKDPQEKRVMLSIRLPYALLAELRARGSVTSQIEKAIEKYLEKPV